jgi:hypothetical protein
MPGLVSGGQNAVVGRGLVEILPDFRKFGKQLVADMRVAKGQLDGSTNGLKAAAGTVVTSMAKVGKGVTLVGAGVAIASVKMAGDFQAETAVLQTAAGESAAGLKVVRQGILDISKGTGTGIKNLTDGMYLIEKAGFRGSDGLKVLKAAAQGAREENAKLSDVTNAMTSVMASYHLKATDSVRVMNGMKTAAGEGKITMEEFSGAMSTVLPIASANKISFEQVAGAVATLTQHGTTAREATHELGATIRALASPNNVASREMTRFGLSSVDVSQHLGKRGLTGTIDLLTSTILSKMGPSGKILLSVFEGSKQSAEDARIMLSKMTPEMQKLARQYSSGSISVSEWRQTLKALPTTQANILSQFASLTNRSKGFSREIKNGGPAAKTYTDALKKMSGGAIGLNTILQLSGESADGFKERVKKVGESFHNGSKDVEGWKITQNLLNVQLARAKQAVQVLMIEIGTKLIPVVSSIIQFFTRHRTITMLLIGSFLSLLAVLSAVYIGTKLFALYTGIATAVMFAWNVATMAETESMAVMRAQLAVLWIMQKAQAIATGIATAAQWAFNAAMDANPIALIVIGIAALIAIIVLVAMKTQFFQKIWHAMWGGLKAATLGFVHWLKSNWQLIIFAILTGGIGLAVAEIVRHWDGVKHAFSVVVDFIKHHWTEMLAFLFGFLGISVLMIVRHWDAIKDGAVKAFNAVINFAVAFGKDFVSFFSHLPGEIGHFFSILPGLIGHWFTVAGQAIGSFFAHLPGNIAKAATGFGHVLTHAGGDLISGLWKGATDFFTKSVPGFFKMLWHGIVDFFKVVFGISSPSTVMARLGIDLIRGLFVGMLKIATLLNTWLADHIGKPIIHLFTVSIPNAAKSFASRVSDSWNSLRGHINDAWNTVKHHTIDPIIHFFSVSIPNAGRHMRDAVIGFVRTLMLRVLDFFGNIIKGAAKLFGWVPGVGGKLKSAAKKFQDFRDNVNKAFGGIKDHKVTVPVGFTVTSGKNAGLKNIGGILRAYGGPIFGRGTETSDDVPVMASHNEHMWSAREVKGAGGHGTMAKLRALARTGVLKDLMRAGVIPGLAQGGAVSAVGKTPSYKTINSKVQSVIAAITRANAQAIYNSMIPNVGSVGGHGVTRWTGTVHAALSLLRQSIGWTSTVLRRMNQESGGNPTVVNRWDSNWKAGHPSVGLMQVIAGTFRAYAGRYRGVGPFSYGVSTNPSANTYAGLNYAIHRYGSLSALNRPGGYDRGGIARGIGAFLKGTSAPERVLSPRQTAAFERLVSHLGRGHSAGSALTIERLILENHGVIGSKHELENWLVELLETLKRKGRIK